MFVFHISWCTAKSLDPSTGPQRSPFHNVWCQKRTGTKKETKQSQFDGSPFSFCHEKLGVRSLMIENILSDVSFFSIDSSRLALLGGELPTNPVGGWTFKPQLEVDLAYKNPSEIVGWTNNPPKRSKWDDPPGSRYIKHPQLTYHADRQGRPSLRGIHPRHIMAAICDTTDMFIFGQWYLRIYILVSAIDI